jgi:hypothetical protein
MANSTTITGEEISAGTPTDPDLCRVSGTLRNVQGQLLVGWYIMIRHIYKPVAVSTDTLVLQEQGRVMTNDEGFVQFDLYRDSELHIELSNLLGHMHFHVYVPDQASIDINDLLIPRIVSAAFTDSDPIAVSVDEIFEVGVEGTLSDGRAVDLYRAAQLSVGNETLLRNVSSNSFQALAAGSTTISMDSIDESLIDDFNEDTQGNDIVRLDVPATTLPSDITVNIS